MTRESRLALIGFIVVTALTTIAVWLLATAPDDAGRITPDTTPSTPTPTLAIADQPTLLPLPLTADTTPPHAVRGAAIQLSEPPPAPSTIPRPPHHDTWLALAECESGGNWSINTGNGYFGGIQFSLTSWRGVGGTGYPHQASPLEQMWAGERLLAIQGWRAWPGCSRRLGLR